MIPTDPFEEGEQTLIRPDRHHQEELEEPSDDFEHKELRNLKRPRRVPRPKQERKSFSKGRPKQERNCCSKGHRRKEQSSLVKQDKNAMMSSISLREEQPSSKARKSFKTFYNECMTSLRTDGLSSGYDHPGLMHSERTSHLVRDRKNVRKRCPIRHEDQ